MMDGTKSAWIRPIWIRANLILVVLFQVLFFFLATAYFGLIMLMPGRYFSYDYYVWLCTEYVHLPYEIEVVGVAMTLDTIFAVLFLVGFLTFLFFRPLRRSISIRRLILVMAAGTLLNVAIYAFIYFHVTHYRLFMMLIPGETSSLVLLYLVYRGWAHAQPSLAE